MGDMAPGGLSRLEKIVFYLLLAISAGASGASWFYSDFRGSGFEESRLKIEQDLLELQRESQRQTTTLNEIELVLGNQERENNTIDQRLRLIELIQSARPAVETFTVSADSSASYASISYCFRNFSKFSSIVTFESIEFRGIGPLGEDTGAIEPYLLLDDVGVGEVPPSLSATNLLAFRLKDFDRGSKNYKATAVFKFQTPEFIKIQLKTLGNDLGVEIHDSMFEFTQRQVYTFFNGYFDTQTYKNCE